MKKSIPMLYVSFDQVPAPKGASTHIEANAIAIGKHFGCLILVTPGPQDEPLREFAPGVRQLVLGCPDRDLLGRVMTFRTKIAALLEKQVFEIIHFRSIFEGYPLVQRNSFDASLIYEVNGLPSIELKYAYPKIRGDVVLQSKLMHQENECFKRVDQVITISEVTKRYLILRGCDAQKITVIRNGVNADRFPYRTPLPLAEEPLRLIYVGTLAPWQGVEIIFQAMALVQQQLSVVLTLVGPGSRERKEVLGRTCIKLGIHKNVKFAGTKSQSEIVNILHSSHACIVPLTRCDRNTTQGCCPFKLIEAMASGCPLIASDLPVVQELAKPELHYLAVPPEDPQSMATAFHRIANERDGVLLRSQQARNHVMTNYTWKDSTANLLDLYEAVLSTGASRVSRCRRSTVREN